jgi:TonB-dependent starch-binding outer membrane protein SusC
VSETNTQVITIAGFAEQRFEIADRFFVTPAVRFDDASTSGQNQSGFVVYPSVNASYVISEEGWFPKLPGVNLLRLRAAYGESGQRVNFRQATTFFNPVSVNALSATASVPAVTIGGPVGNADLRPEITAETEGGFELGMLNNRLRFEFTGFTRDTRDLLISRILAPSLGVAANQFVNLSNMNTKGAEALIDVTPIDTRAVRWNQTIAFTALSNKIVGLGVVDGQPVQPIIQGVQQFRAGYPAGAFFQRRILDYGDYNNDGLISNVNCPAYGGLANPVLVGGPRCEILLSDSLDYIGNQLPTREIAYNTNITLFKNFNLNALLQYRGGLKLYNNTREFRNNGGFANGPDFWDRRSPISEQLKSAARAMGTSDGYIEDASFLRLSEVSATWTVPAATAKLFGAGGLSITLAGRNMGLWTDYSGFDPEVLTNPGAAFGQTDFLTNPPIRRWALRVNFLF